MKIAVLVLGLACLIALAACGDDDAGASSGAGGAGGTGGRASHAGVGGTSGGKSLACGASTCRVPADSPYELCCKDEFTSSCGSLIGGQCRQMRAPVVENCPLPDIPGIADAAAGSNAGNGVSGCCTANNECGLDLGIGTGCSSNASFCTFFPAPYSSKLVLITCDGQAIEAVPEPCKATDGAAGTE
jgi:hypothetical protein